MLSDTAIFRADTLRRIAEVAARLGVPADAVKPYWRHKAKLDLDVRGGARPKAVLSDCSTCDNAGSLFLTVNAPAASVSKSRTTVFARRRS